MAKRRTPADIDASIKREAARQATRKIGKLEPIGGGLFASGGQETNLTLCAENLARLFKDEFERQRARRRKLSGLQKGWVKTYIEGATGALEFSEGRGATHLNQCPVFLVVTDAIEDGGLAANFSEIDLLQWASGAGLTLTPVGVAAMQRLQAGASPAAATAKAGGLNIADAIGAAAWAEIRLVIRPGDDTDAGGLTFHYGKKHAAVSWQDAGLHNASELRGVLMLLAKNGVISWGKHLDARRRDFEAKRAREQSAGKMRGRVNKLNTKLAKHFPKGWGNPFYNDDGITKSRFLKIELQHTP